MGFLALYRYYRFIGKPFLLSVQLARQHRMPKR